MDEVIVKHCEVCGHDMLFGLIDYEYVCIGCYNEGIDKNEK